MSNVLCRVFIVLSFQMKGQLIYKVQSFPKEKKLSKLDKNYETRHSVKSFARRNI